MRRAFEAAVWRLRDLAGIKKKMCKQHKALKDLINALWDKVEAVNLCRNKKAAARQQGN